MRLLHLFFYIRANISVVALLIQGLARFLGLSHHLRTSSSSSSSSSSRVRRSVWQQQQQLSAYKGAPKLQQGPHCSFSYFFLLLLHL